MGKTETSIGIAECVEARPDSHQPGLEDRLAQHLGSPVPAAVLDFVRRALTTLTDDGVGLREAMQAEGQALAAASIPLETAFAAFTLARGAEREAESSAELKPERLVSALEGLALGYSRWQDGQQAAIVAENEGLRDQVQVLQKADQELTAWVNELVALQKINAAANSSVDLHEALSLIVTAVAEVARADVCSIFLHDQPGTLVLAATTGLNIEAVGHVAIALGEGITGKVAQERLPIAARDAWNDPRFKHIPEIGEENFLSLLSLPIILYASDKLVGVLNVQSREYRTFRDDEIAFLQTVARQIAIGLENARRYEQTDEKLQEKVRQLTTLHRVSSLIASTIDLQDVLFKIARQGLELSHMDFSMILRWSERQEELEVLVSSSHDEHTAGGQVLPVKDPHALSALRQASTVVIQDATLDERAESFAPLAAGDAFRSLLWLPLVSRERFLGGICFSSMRPHHFDEEELQLLDVYANGAAVAMEHASLYEEAKRGLTTKSALLQELHHRVRNNLQTVAALLSLQLRHTKGKSARLPLQESINRIHSIAAVHNLLLQRDSGSTSIGEIARQIMDLATVNLPQPEMEVHFSYAGPQIAIHSTQATVVALVVNELVHNAITHGFGEETEGHIKIRTEEGDGVARIEIWNDGHTLPKDFRIEDSGGLGLRIVRTLVEADLKGEFTLRGGDGTTAIISFRPV